MAAQSKVTVHTGGLKPVFVHKFYCFLSSADKFYFCLRVIDALANIYALNGNPILLISRDAPIIAQAVILPEVGEKQIAPFNQ